MFEKMRRFKKALLILAVLILCCVGVALGFAQKANATRTPNFGASFDGGVYGPSGNTGTTGNTGNTGNTGTTGSTPPPSSPRSNS